MADNPRQYGPVLRREDVAEIFKVSIATVDTWTRTHILKPHPVGGLTFFNRSEVMELVGGEKPETKNVVLDWLKNQLAVELMTDKES